MRTTLEIDDGVLGAVRDLADIEERSMGKVISELVQEALANRAAPRQFEQKNGIPQLPLRSPGGPSVTMELIQKMMDEEGI